MTVVVVAFTIVVASLFDGALTSAHDRNTLWIDPGAKPKDATGWDVTLAIRVAGQFSATNVFAIRDGLGPGCGLGLDVSQDRFVYGGQSAMPNYSYVVSFTLNVPAATTGETALAMVAKVTPSALDGALRKCWYPLFKIMSVASMPFKA